MRSFWGAGKAKRLASEEKIVFATAGGVVVHSADKKVISVTDCEGQKKLHSFPEKNKVIFWHFPFFRGIQYFFCGIYAQFCAFLLNLDMCNSKKIKNEKAYFTKQLVFFVLSVVLGCLFAAFGIGFVSGRVGIFLVGYDQSEILRNLVILAVKIAIFLFFLLFLRVFSPINEVFRFNRAGDYALILGENCKNKKQKCPARPLNFLNFIVFVFILDFIVVTLIGANFGFWFNLLFHIAIFIASMMFSYEILALLERTKKLQNLAFITQIFVVAKPSVTHIETALVALSEINLLTTMKGRDFMKEDMRAFSVMYNEVRSKLISAGVNEKSEADWLIATVLGKNRAEIKLISSVTEKQYQDIMRATARRVKGESLDNIFGFTEFYGLRFDVNKKVLTPRMETELLVEQVLKQAKTLDEPKILDLCTGSGAIAVAVKKNCPAAVVTASDISKAALLVAEGNAKKNDVEIEFLHSNLFENLKRKKKFDIIVSNPPYIASEDLPKLDKNVRECDPAIALDGGQDGLDFYRQIIPLSVKRLNAGGYLMLEIGKGQAAKVRKLMRESGFENIKTIKDYNKTERIICGTHK